MIRRICRALSFLAVLNLSVMASAQTAQLSGRVTDPAQAVSAVDVQLSDEEVKRLEAPYKPKPVLDHA